jgi:hypothetical protein
MQVAWPIGSKFTDWIMLAHIRKLKVLFETEGTENVTILNSMPRRIFMLHHQ